MAVQGRSDRKNYSFILRGETAVKDNEILAQDAARAAVLKKYTVLAQVASSRKWVPLTDVTAAATGENTARGIYMGDDIAAATLVAGDVTGALILVGGALATVDAQQLVLENSLTVNSVVNDDPAGADNGVVNVRRIEDDLARIGIYVESTTDIDVLEN